MCVIIHQPAGVDFEREHAHKLWEINKDGAGYSFINPNTNKLRAFKTLSWSQFWSVYRNDWVQFGDRADFLIHMRIATHGSVSLNNCHPFQMNDNTVMFHNGVLNVVIPENDDRSDSRVFAEDYLPLLPTDWLDSPWMHSMIEDWGGWSRMAFMTTHPTLSESIYFTNKEDWIESDGLLLSNGAGTKWTKYTYGGGNTSYLPKGYGGSYLHPFPKPSEDQGGASPIGHPFDYNDDDELWDWGTSGQFHIRSKKPLDFSARRAILKEARIDLGLTKPMAFSVAENMFECMGCDEHIDEVTGMCSCHDVWCTDCNNTGAACNCGRGWSIHLIPLAKLPKEEAIPLPGGGEARAIGLNKVPLRKEATT